MRAAVLVLASVVISHLAHGAQPFPPLETALGRVQDLRLGVYATVDSVRTLAESTQARDEALAVLQGLGVTKIYVEACRSGIVATPEQLATVRDFFRANRFDVVGAIATVPGNGFGIAANTGLAWLNFQAPETQAALAVVMRQSAPLFDTFIVDDFLCSGDTSEQSNQARGDRSWSEYRRDLMVQVSRDVLIGPAKEVNPGIRMIIKYPQWYDLFHRFGYDTVREPEMYDGVWVGTETRGFNTQRFGFTPPYMGFINYRWISALAGEKIGGAWFDHGDCREYDFIEQAWQSVAAGARELVLFNFGDIVNGHPDHARLRDQFSMLADLAAFVRTHPVVGPVAYKPPHSDAGDDLYIMDFIGMLGISLVPSPTFPSEADTIFLPTQAAADPEVVEKLKAALQAGKHVIVTPGFLSASGSEELSALSGLAEPIVLKAMRADTAGPNHENVHQGLDLAADLKVADAAVLVSADVTAHSIPFLTSRQAPAGRLSVLNTRTYSQADFDAVGEVLLSPRDLGLTHLPENVADIVRSEFMRGVDWQLRAPARVTCQQMGNEGWLVQNYNSQPAKATLYFANAIALKDGFTGKAIPLENQSVELNLAARGRAWLVTAD